MMNKVGFDSGFRFGFDYFCFDLSFWVCVDDGSGFYFSVLIQKKNFSSVVLDAAAEAGFFSPSLF
jgi:hypothetical protein